jgi:hypothetical protein
VLAGRRRPQDQPGTDAARLHPRLLPFALGGRAKARCVFVIVELRHACSFYQTPDGVKEFQRTIVPFRNNCSCAQFYIDGERKITARCVQAIVNEMLS